MEKDQRLGSSFLALSLLVFLLPALLVSTFWLLNTNQGSYQQFLAKTKIDYQSRLASTPVRLYQALPNSTGSVSFEVGVADARPVIIRQYLERYRSPLADYADHFFQISQKYDLDYRLLVAIAQQESNLGKKVPDNTHNAWGWGIHSRGTLGFSSWEEGIETVARGLRENYLNRGFVDLEQIAARYAPPSKESWAFGVGQFMKEME
ncbi:MAG: hypothetical protein PHR64_01735 [Candidatus Shapirobacteria bacterium]|nr:hypothetical protein [Candidatus Shapirobacteria bacterium]